MLKFLKPALLLAACGLGTSLWAGELSIHGFGTLGIAHVDKPGDWAYARSLQQEPNDDELRFDLDSVLGLQLNYAFASGVELVGQASAARLDREAKPLDYLDLAFAAWRPTPELALRLGRVNLDAYLISDFRDVGFTYHFLRPPVEYYMRMPTSVDGGDIARTWLQGSTQWQAKLFTGRAEFGSGNGRLKFWPLYGAVLSRESDGLLLRATAVRARLRNNIEETRPLFDALEQLQALPVPQVADEARALQRRITLQGSHTNYLAAAAGWDRHDWLLNAEFNIARTEGPAAVDFTTGYASVGRRFGPVTVHITEAAQVGTRDAEQTPDWATPLTPINPVLAQQAQAVAVGASDTINFLSPHQHTTSLGARWDLAPHMALKAQWDHVRVHDAGGGLWLKSTRDGTRANVFAVALDFVF